MVIINRLARENVEKTIKEGGVLHFPLFSVRYLKNTAQQSRLSFVVSKKEEKTAVGRNYMRRRVKEAFKKAQNTHILSMDMVIFIKKTIKLKDFEVICEEVNQALLKLQNFQK